MGHLALNRHRGFGALMVKVLAFTVFIIGTSNATNFFFRPNAAELYTKLAHAAWVPYGHGPKILYSIFDPNCPYCHMLFKELEPLIGPDHLTVREVPVGYLTKTSLLKAATILESKNPLQTILRGESGYVFKHGMAVELTNPSRRTRFALNHNLELLKATTGYRIVPVLVYLNRAGTAKFVAGQPDAKTLKTLIASIKQGHR